MLHFWLWYQKVKAVCKVGVILTLSCEVCPSAVDESQVYDSSNSSPELGVGHGDSTVFEKGGLDLRAECPSHK